MKTGIDSAALVAAGLASVIAIATIVLLIRYDYRKKGIGHQFRLTRVAFGFLILSVFFFGMLVLGMHFQVRWDGAAPLAVAVGYLIMLFGGVAFIKKKKNEKYTKEMLLIYIFE